MVNLVKKRQEDLEKKRKEALRAPPPPTPDEEEDDAPPSVATVTLPVIVKKKPKERDDLSLMKEWDMALLKEMKFKTKESKMLWTKWNEMIGDDGRTSQKLDYDSFLFYFNLKDETWVKRTFDVMNQSLSGKTTFTEFLKFLTKYILIDIEGTNEFCFRLLSRRGSTFVKAFSVLDLDDIGM